MVFRVVLHPLNQRQLFAGPRRRKGGARGLKPPLSLPRGGLSPPSN